MGNLREYRLHGPQVESTTLLWLDSPAVRVPTLRNVQDYAESKDDTRLYLSLDLFPNDAALEREYGFIKILEKDRINKPHQTISFEVGAPVDFQRLTDLGRFIHLKDPPFGAVFDVVERPQINFNTVNDQQLRILLNSSIINEGQELARTFEGTSASTNAHLKLAAIPAPGHFTASPARI